MKFEIGAQGLRIYLLHPGVFVADADSPLQTLVWPLTLFDRSANKLQAEGYL
jgi:hypothetical protein